MYNYAFLNCPVLCQTLRGLGFIKITSLLIDRPDNLEILKSLSQSDKATVRSMVETNIASISVDQLTPRLVYEAIVTRRMEAAKACTEFDKAARFFMWLGHAVVLLDFGKDDAARQVEADQVNWDGLHDSLMKFHSTHPAYLADRFASTFCRHRDFSRHHNRYLKPLLARIAAKAFGKDLEWSSKVDMADIIHIADWLKGAVDRKDKWLQNTDEHGVPKKLAKLNTIEAAYSEADKQMLRRITGSGKGTLGVRDAEVFSEGEGDYYLAHLKTSAALDLESYRMRHCVGDGAYDDSLERDGHLILSLRDRNHMPHLTIEIEGSRIVQCRGKANSAPKEIYKLAAEELLALHGITFPPPPPPFGNLCREIRLEPGMPAWERVADLLAAVPHAGERMPYSDQSQQIGPFI